MLQVLESWEWENADSLSREIWKLDVIGLHEIIEPSDIKNICDEVIRAVELSLLVPVDEKELLKRKLKRDRSKPLQYLIHSDDEASRNGVELRTAWASIEWTEHILPYGWAYRDKGKKKIKWKHELLGIIYKTKQENWHAFFIRQEIANNPHGAFLLIKKWEKSSKN